MGSDFLTNEQFQTALEENPELITWSSLREVILHRGKTGKLGFKVHTFKVLFLARLHEVQKSYCSHPGRTRSRSRSRSTLR